MANHPAAFINVIAEEGTKDEAVEWLQKTWDDLQNLRLQLIKKGYSLNEINQMQNEVRARTAWN